MSDAYDQFFTGGAKSGDHGTEGRPGQTTEGQGTQQRPLGPAQSPSGPAQAPSGPAQAAPARPSGSGSIDGPTEIINTAMITLPPGGVTGPSPTPAGPSSADVPETGPAAPVGQPMTGPFEQARPGYGAQQQFAPIPGWTPPRTDHGEPADQQFAGYAPMPTDNTSHGQINTQDQFANQTRAQLPPTRGWRRAVYTATGLNLGLSSAEEHERELIAMVRQNVRDSYHIAFISEKGGVGKTCLTIGVGSTFAMHRGGDHVIAVDADPDHGNIAERLPRQAATTMTDLLLRSQDRYTDIRQHTSQNSSNLEVLASNTDPAHRDPYVGEMFVRTTEILDPYYSLVLADCGTGMKTSAMSGVLSTANAIVLVTDTTIDGANAALHTIAALRNTGRHDLLNKMVIAINHRSDDKPRISVRELVDRFSRQRTAVQVIPYDPHFSDGTEIEPGLLKKKTRLALLELSALLGRDFNAHNRHGQVG